MIIKDAIHENAPYCVYAHAINCVLFYVGSGALPRAFESGAARRNNAWNGYIERQGRPPVTVDIISRFSERSSARRVEYDLIRRYRPIANLPLELGMDLEWQEMLIEDKLVATDAYTGYCVQVLPEGWVFPTVKEAAKGLGVSPGAISNSITGRYPMVGQRSFRRIPRSSRTTIRAWDEPA